VERHDGVDRGTGRGNVVTGLGDGGTNPRHNTTDVQWLYTYDHRTLNANCTTVWPCPCNRRRTGLHILVHEYHAPPSPSSVAFFAFYRVNTAGSRAIVSETHGDRGAQTYNRGRGAEPPAGFSDRPLVRGQGAKTPEADRPLHYHNLRSRSICHESVFLQNKKFVGRLGGMAPLASPGSAMRQCM